MKKEQKKGGEKFFNIQSVAQEFKQVFEQMEILNKRLKELKTELAGYAKVHKVELTEDFKMVFDNGVYVSLRNKVEIDGSEEGLAALVDRLKDFDGCVVEVLDDKKVVSLAKVNNIIAKHISASGCEVVSKDVWAVYGK